MFVKMVVRSLFVCMKVSVEVKMICHVRCTNVRIEVRVWWKKKKGVRDPLSKVF